MLKIRVFYMEIKFLHMLKNLKYIMQKMNGRYKILLTIDRKYFENFLLIASV